VLTCFYVSFEQDLFLLWGLSMSAEFISRIIGMITLAVGGSLLGIYVANRVGGSPFQFGGVFLLVGALFGLVLTPYVTVRPFVALRKRISHAPAHRGDGRTVGQTAPRAVRYTGTRSTCR
jgi:hypothetical protein